MLRARMPLAVSSTSGSRPGAICNGQLMFFHSFFLFAIFDRLVSEAEYLTKANHLTANAESVVQNVGHSCQAGCIQIRPCKAPS